MFGVWSHWCYSFSHGQNEDLGANNLEIIVDETSGLGLAHYHKDGLIFVDNLIHFRYQFFIVTI